MSQITRSSGLDRKTVRRVLGQLTWQPYQRAPAEETLLSPHRAWLTERAPQFPDRFGSIEDSLAFCVGFFRETAAVIEQRAAVLTAAYAAHPERFVRRAPRPAEPPTAVWINPPKPVDGNANLQ